MCTRGRRSSAGAGFAVLEALVVLFVLSFLIAPTYRLLRLLEHHTREALAEAAAEVEAIEKQREREANLFRLR